MINYEYKNPLTENEKKEVLKQFKNYLESNKNTLEIKENGIDPFKENCYISNNDVISGIYFPNNEITIKEGNHRDLFYDFICIGKNKRGELGYYAQLKPEKHNENSDPLGALCENIFKPFIKINEAYFDIKNKMNESLKDYESNLKILKSFKVVTKKDGSIFQNYDLNFIFKNCNDEEKHPHISADHDYRDQISSVEIFFNYNFKVYYNIPTADRKPGFNVEKVFTPQMIYNNFIVEEIKHTEKQIQELKKNLKDLLKDFLKIEKMKFNYEKEKEKYYKKNYFLNNFMCIKY